MTHDGIELPDPAFELGDLLPDPAGRGAAFGVFDVYNLVDGHPPQRARLEGRVEALQFLQRQLIEADVLSLAVGHNALDHAVGLPESAR